MAPLRAQRCDTDLLKTGLPSHLSLEQACYVPRNDKQVVQMKAYISE